MSRLSVALLLALAVAACLSASVPQKEEKVEPRIPRQKLMIHGRPIHGLVPTPETPEETPETKGINTPLYYTQTLDHFDSNNMRTFQQVTLSYSFLR